MAVRIRYDESLEDKVCLDASPATETCFALHCLAFPECHPLQADWIGKTAAELPARLHAEIVEFGRGPSDEWFGPTDLIASERFLPFEADIAKARSLSKRSIQESAEVWASLDDTGIDRVAANIDAMREDPLGWRDRACDLLEQFWPYFRATWNRLEKTFVRQLKTIEEWRSEGMNMTRLLPLICPQIAWDADQKELVLASRFERQMMAADLVLLEIRPSYFVIPHPALDPREQLRVVTWVPDALGPAVQESLAPLIEPLRALADPTRLRLLEAVARGPRCARELAGDLDIGERAVTRQLAVLTAAGILRQVGASQSGAYARHEVNPEIGFDLIRRLTLLLGTGRFTEPR